MENHYVLAFAVIRISKLTLPTFLAWLLMGFCMECGVKGHFISFWNEKANKQRLYSIPSMAVYVLLGCNGEFISVDTQCIVKTLYSIIPSFSSSLHIKGEMVLQPLFAGEGSWLPRPMLQWFSQSYRRTASNFAGFSRASLLLLRKPNCNNLYFGLVVLQSIQASLQI